MNSIYQAALNGTLASPAGGTSVGNVTYTNNIEIPVALDLISSIGTHMPMASLSPGSNITFGPTLVGQYILVTALNTGAFITVITIAASVTAYAISCSLLADPNDIGPVPQPNSAVLIPPNSPRVLVACGLLSNHNYLTREQYWCLQPDSYCLAPNEEKTVSLTNTAGKQQTTSKQETIATSLGVSASGGWGPISASLSASLSASSTTFQQVTITEEVTSYISEKLTNSETATSLFLRWQLTDIITVFDPNGSALSSVILGQNPVLLMGPYNIMQLPAPPVFAEVESVVMPKVIVQPAPAISNN